MLLHCLASSIVLWYRLQLATGQTMLGTGQWSVLSVQQCENDAEMPWRVSVRRHKLNRTHDAFDGTIALPVDVDDSYSARAEVCKVVEGGCKPLANESRECLPCLVREWAAENARIIFESLAIDPPDFPMPKGEYQLDNYLLNVEDLTKKGMYGQFQGVGYIVKDGLDMACLRMTVKFEPLDDYGASALYG